MKIFKIKKYFNIFVDLFCDKNLKRLFEKIAIILTSRSRRTHRPTQPHLETLVTTFILDVKIVALSRR